MVPATAVLFSSGLDSAVLAVSEARTGRVHPVYVSAGLAWLYRAQDDVWKLEAFTRLRNRYLKTGKFSRDEAIARASLEVTKYMPSFNMNSQFSELVGGVIPFVSFTNEAVRCW